MFKRNSSLSFISLLAETGCLFLPYYLLSILIKTPAGQIMTFPQFLLLIVTAGVVNWLISLKSRPLLSVAALNLAAATLAAALLGVWILPGGSALWAGLLFKGSSLGGSLQLWLAFGLTGWIFLRSMIIFNSTIIYQETVNRFEAAIVIVWGAVLAAELIPAPMPDTIVVLAFCLISNLTAIASARFTAIPSQSYISALGILIALTCIAVLLLNFSHSYMLSASQWLYDSTFPYLGLVFYSVITWLLKKGHYLPDQRSSTIGSAEATNSANFGSHNSPLNSHWMQLLSSAIGVVAAILLAIVILLLGFYLVKYLLRKRSFSPVSGSSGNINYSWLSIKLINLLKRLGIIRLLLQPGKLGVDLLYQGLLYWGKRKNMGRKDFETPYEYCSRLGTSFPRQQERLLQITDAYVRFRFGQHAPEPARLRELRSAFRKLFKPPF